MTATSTTVGPLVLSVEGLRLRRDSPQIDADFRSGEIVGLAGLDGHGQEEFLEVLCGLRRAESGVARLDPATGGKAVTGFHDAVRRGIAFLPRERKTSGILPGLSVLDNFAITTLGSGSRAGLVRWREQRRRYDRFRERLGIVARSPRMPIDRLSGGNQQKVLLARWLATEPRVLLLNDPTRGVDMATRVSLYDVFRDLARQSGTCIVLVSTEIDELLQVCDRTLVFRESHVFRELTRDEMTMSAIIAAMFGRDDDD